jgi:hypothetical protein
MSDECGVMSDDWNAALNLKNIGVEVLITHQSSLIISDRLQRGVP